MRSYIRIVLASMVLLVFTSCGAWAINVDIFNSIHDIQTGDALDIMASHNGSIYPQAGCQEFVVGGDYSALMSVTISFADGIAFVPDEPLTASIYDATGVDYWGSAPNAPGSLIANLVGSTDPITAGNYIYKPSSTLVLNPNTPYYLVLSTPTDPGNPGAYEWQYTTDTNAFVPGTGPLWWGFNNSDGRGWYMGYYGGEGATNPQAMDINVQTPEPGTLALLLMGLPIGLFWRKSRA